MLSRLPDPSWGKEDGLQAKAADRVREVAGEYLAAGGARAAECSPPLQPGPLVCQSKRAICPFAKNVNRRAHLGAPLFTHLWSREVLIVPTLGKRPMSFCSSDASTAVNQRQSCGTARVF